MNGNLIGQVLLNQFRVDAFVASGGMGAVYRVWDLKRNVPLAMKTLHTELAEDPAIFKRFKREARALKKLTHPNIVPFYGLYETADFVFLLQAFIDGRSLRDILRSRNGQPLPLSEALVYIKALSAALGFAHAHDVVHCDVKPDNVMIDQGGNIYLTDFGIARHAESTTTSLATVGTAAYMAPEQIRGDTVSPATDVYALGVMLFEMLAGERPFKGSEKGTESGGQTVNERIRYAHLHLSIPDPSTIFPQITPALAAVLLKSLEKDPANRYSDTLEMFSALCIASEFSQESVPNRLLPSGKEVAGLDTQSGQTPPFLPSGQTLTRRPGIVFALFGSIGMVLTLFLIFFNGRLGGDQTKIADTGKALTSTALAFEIIAPSRTPQVRTATPRATLTSIPKSPTPTPTKEATPIIVRKNPIDGAETVYVPPGNFQMGLNRNQAEVMYQLCTSFMQGCELSFFMESVPSHNVRMDAFWIDPTEVSNVRYKACVDAGVCTAPRRASSATRDLYYGNQQFDNYPVIYVNWYQADAYCTWAGGQLPTEAQWEYAARGNDGHSFPWGDQPPISSGMANVADQVGDTMPVNSYKEYTSPFGLYNMAGNVWEWVSDWYGADYYSMNTDWENPSGPSTGIYKVGKGGSHGWSAGAASPGLHDWYEPDRDGYGVGFRCAYDEP